MDKTSQGGRAGVRAGARGDLQALLDDIQQDEQAKDIHASHGDGPQQVWPEEAMLGAHCVIVTTWKQQALSHLAGHLAWSSMLCLPVTFIQQ